MEMKPGLPSAEADRYAWGGEYFIDGPRIHEFMREMNREVLSQREVMTVGEMPGVGVKEAKLYTADDRKELNMVFQFEHMDVDSGPGGKWDVKPWTLDGLRTIMHKWQVDLAESGWNSLYLNNHDQPRMVSRFGDDGVYRKQSAKMLATFLHTLKGTPYIYQGEELGMFIGHVFIATPLRARRSDALLVPLSRQSFRLLQRRQRRNGSFARVL
ncbi:hypothetical protein GCM10010916_21670 [Paenibacillus abyssi]|uniref:oligo-1,6-glucosidase n=1 Tax=Paenibacillus abyssi TaxID=1340531 RepID=A0A917D2H4_9BACL|nr:hypothetical protein GCM10010916_21670 [Paenibacillus abyssi]